MANLCIYSFSTVEEK